MRNGFNETVTDLYEITPTWEPYADTVKCEGVLVTGGAGFLGIHLLRQLVLCGKFKEVYTIVRNPDKLKTQAMACGIDGPWRQCVRVIVGDLKNIPFELLPRVETVIHGAAQIHAIKSKEQLWVDNVEVTKKILSYYPSAKIVFISTLSVFVSSNLKGLHIQKPIELSAHHMIYGGYAQTKAIGELMCQKHSSCTIVRPGLLTSSNSVIYAQDDFFKMAVKALKRIGGLPARKQEAFVDMTPVDACAERIVHHLHLNGGVYHIANAQSFSLTEMSDELKLVNFSKDEWQERLSQEPTLIHWLLRYATEKEDCIQERLDLFNVDLFQSTGHQYEGATDFGSNVERFRKYVKIIEKEM
jgi:thioester reductase-like protein